MECLGLWPLGTQLGCGGFVDHAVDKRHAVEPPRGIGGHEAARHVLGHMLWRTIEGMAVAAAAAGLDPQHVTVPEHIAVRQRRQLALVVGAGIDQDAATAARHAAVDAPRRVFDAIDADGQHGLLGQDIVLAHDAAAAAIPPCAAGVDEDAVGAQPYRIAGLQELDGVVLLRHEIDGVGAIGVGPGAPADADAVGHQEGLELALVVAEGAAQEGDHVGRMRRRRLAAGNVYEPVHRRQETHQGEAAHAERGGEFGPEQGALAQAHLVERLRAAGVAHLGRIAAQIEHRERGPRHVGVQQQVHRPGRLVVGLGGVEDEAIAAVRPAFARQGQPQMKRAVAMAIGIDRVGEAVGAVGEGLGELGAHQVAGARHELVERIGQDVGAEACGDLLDATHTQRRARHQRPHVAHILLGEARAEEDL